MKKKIVSTLVASVLLLGLSSGLTTAVDAATTTQTSSVQALAATTTQVVRVTNPNGAMLYQLGPNGLTAVTNRKLAFNSDWAGIPVMVQEGKYSNVYVQAWQVDNTDLVLIYDVSVVR